MSKSRLTPRLKIKLRNKLIKARHKLTPLPYRSALFDFEEAKRQLQDCSHLKGKKVFLNHLPALEKAIQSLLIHINYDLPEEEKRKKDLPLDSFEKRIQFLRANLMRLLREEETIRDDANREGAMAQKKLDQEIYDALFRCLLILAAYWPIHLKHQCSISGISSIDFKNMQHDLIVFSTGHQCHRGVLKLWLENHPHTLLVDEIKSDGSIVKAELPISTRDANHVLARMPELETTTKNAIASRITPFWENKINEKRERDNAIGRKIAQGITVLAMTAYLCSYFIAFPLVTAPVGLSFVLSALFKGFMDDGNNTGFIKGFMWGILYSLMLATVLSPICYGLDLLGNHMLHLLNITTNENSPLKFTGGYVFKSSFEKTAYLAMLYGSIASVILPAYAAVIPHINYVYNMLMQKAWSGITYFPSKIIGWISESIGVWKRRNNYSVENRARSARHSMEIYEARLHQTLASSAYIQKELPSVSLESKRTVHEDRDIKASPSSSPLLSSHRLSLVAEMKEQNALSVITVASPAALRR